MRNYNGMLWWPFIIRSFLELNSPLVIIRTASFHTQSSTICPHGVFLHTTAFIVWSYWQTTQWSVCLHMVQCRNNINICFGVIVFHSLHLVHLCRDNHVDSKNAVSLSVPVAQYNAVPCPHPHSSSQFVVVYPSCCCHRTRLSTVQTVVLLFNVVLWSRAVDIAATAIRYDLLHPSSFFCIGLRQQVAPKVWYAQHRNDRYGC